MKTKIVTMRRGRVQSEHVLLVIFLKMFVVCRRYDGKAFHTRGLAAEKLLSPKLSCVRRMS